MWDKKSHWKEESEKEVNWEKEEDSEEWKRKIRDVKREEDVK